jgi:hypothetical protein
VRTDLKKRKLCRKNKADRKHWPLFSQKKGKELIALAAVGTRGKPRMLENNLIRYNSTKSKMKEHEQDAKSDFPFKPTKLHQIHRVHRPPSLI